MAKTLTIHTDNADFLLEFTRASAAQMEAQGFSAEELTSKPNLRWPQLFAGAFLAHHRRVKPDYVQKLWDKMENKEKLIGALAEMYGDTAESLLAEPEEGAQGNATWTAGW